MPKGLHMDYLGKIRSISFSGIDKGRWIEVIRTHGSLSLGEPATRPNPFAPGETMTLRPKPDTAHVTVDSNKVGLMEWAQTRENEITVYGIPGQTEAMERVAGEIANLLDAEFLPW